MASQTMYESINVWRRIGRERVVCYRCFRIYPSRQYCVQSTDFFNLLLSDADRINSDRQFVELLTEEPPESRGGSYASLDEAIAAHEALFETSAQ